MDPAPSAHPVGTLSALESHLAQAFPGSRVMLRDDSSLHLGHPGRPDGFGHLHLEIVADQFTGCTPLERHRMIHHALGPLDGWRLHALGIGARAPGEGPPLPSSSAHPFTPPQKEVPQ